MAERTVARCRSPDTLHDFITGHTEMVMEEHVQTTTVSTLKTADIVESKSCQATCVCFGKEGGNSKKTVGHVCTVLHKLTKCPAKDGITARKSNGFQKTHRKTRNYFSLFYVYRHFLKVFLAFRQFFLFIRHWFYRYFCLENDESMDNLTIKDNIRKIRKARRLTQEEMAMQLGISVTAYRDLERGSTSILNSNIYRIADLLGTPTEEIVLGYMPSQAEGATLQEVQMEYSGRIETLERRILDLEKLVSSQEDTIRSKNEIISMLKKRLGEDR